MWCFKKTQISNSDPSLAEGLVTAMLALISWWDERKKSEQEFTVKIRVVNAITLCLKQAN